MIKNLPIFKSLIVLLLLTCSLQGRANDLILAGPSQATIVIGENASPTEIYAATELQRVLKIMSGAELQIVTAGGQGSGALVVIGSPEGNSLIYNARTKLRLDGSHEEQISVLREGSILYLGGQTARASLYATFTFLEDILGVRWFWPGADGEYITKRDTVSVQEVSIFETPSIASRSLGLTSWGGGTPETDDWEAHNKFNMLSVRHSRVNDPETIARFDKGFQARISGHFIVLPEETLQAHPEYAALYNGSRSYTFANRAQLCWGNPGVQEEVANLLKGLWEAAPYVELITFFPADNQTYCTDELCKALAPDVSTRWQKFSQLVIEKVDESLPGKRYATLAYQAFKEVPDMVAPRFEYAGYTLYEASYRHLLSSGFSGSAGALAEIEGWQALGAKMGIRGYEYIMFNEPMFVPMVSWEVDQMAWIKDEGLITYGSELPAFGFPKAAAPEDTYWVSNRLNLYAAAKGAWDSEVTAESIVNDWCTTIYGPAAEEMIAYYWDIENAWRTAPGDIQEYNKAPVTQVDNFLSPEVFIRLNGYFTRARTKLAEITDPTVRQRTAEQIDLESRMLAKWQSIYNFKHNRAPHFETVVEKVETANDATLKSLTKLPAFENAAGEVVDEQTIVSKAWTETDLVFRVVCQDAAPESIIANGSSDDAAAILSDDSVELYIQSDLENSGYMHFAVNSLGKRYDAITTSGGTDFDISWDQEWTATTSVGEDRWTVNIRIPLASLGLTAKDSTKFKLAVKRTRGERAESSGWPDASYYNPASFGVATLITEVVDPVGTRIILFDGGGKRSDRVSAAFQLEDWQVVRDIAGEEELKQKLEEDAAVLILKGGQLESLSKEFYLNEIHDYLEKGRVVVISTAGDLPVQEWFPGTPAVQWSGYNQNLSASRISYELPGDWQVYPNDLRSEIERRPTPVTAFETLSEGWRVLLKMPMEDGRDLPFLLTRRIGDGLLVLTSSNMGYSGGYEMFGNRRIPNVVELMENFVAEVLRGEQTITFEELPEKVLGEPDFALTASSDSGLPVSYTSSNEAVATVTGNMVHLTGLGTTTITASQKGNEHYIAAESVSQVLVVVPDTEAPSAPEGLVAEKETDHKVMLSWQSSTDNIGVVGYNIYRNGILINTSLITGNSFLAERPEGQNVYQFTVKAVDAEGNISLASNPAFSDNGNRSHNIIVYPNPARDQFTLLVNTEQNGEIVISIYNASGSLMSSISDVKEGAYEKEMNVGIFPPGSYTIKITVNGFSETKKLIVN